MTPVSRPWGWALPGSACRGRLPSYGLTHGRIRSSSTPHHAPRRVLPLFRAEQFVWLTRTRAGAASLRVPLPARQPGRGGSGTGRLPQRRRRVRARAGARSARTGQPAPAPRTRCGCWTPNRALRAAAGGARMPLSTSVSTPDGALPAVHPSQRGYPTAPFVPVVDDPPRRAARHRPGGRAAAPQRGLARLAVPGHRLCWQAVESLDKSTLRGAAAVAPGLRSQTARARRPPPTGWAAWCGSSGSRCWTRTGSTRSRSPPATLRASTTSTRLRPPSRLVGARVVHRRGDVALAGSPGRRAAGRTAAGRSGGAGGLRPRHWRRAPLVTIEALRTLRAYGRFVG